jgi:hypothetical protein
MTRAPRPITGLALFAIAAVLAGRAATRPAPAAAPDAHAPDAAATGLLQQLPVAFVANEGQWDTPAAYVARGDGITLRAERDALVLQSTLRGTGDAMHGVAVRLAFEGARADVALAGEGELPGVHNFLNGPDSARWRTGVRAYASLLYHGLHEGIDLRVRSAGRALEYDVLLAPGADLDRFAVRCEGTLALAIDPDGALAMTTALGTIRHTAPITWQERDDGTRVPTVARFRLLGADRFGFSVPNRDPSLALVIDPGLSFSTCIGGFDLDYALGVAVDATGAATVVGYTLSTDFPVTTGAFDTSFNGFVDAYVARVAPSGSSLVYATYLGGIGDDRAFAVAVDAAGAATVTGYTYSSDFPTTAGAFDTSHNGSSDAFVTRLSPTGVPVWSTFLGGSGADQGGGVALDPSGAATVVGSTQSSTFPTTIGAYDTSYNLRWDAFATRITATGDGLMFSTFLGGSFGDDYANAVAVDPFGAAIVVGTTSSGDFPGAVMTMVLFDAFVVRLSSLGGLVRSTCLGGLLTTDTALGVAVDAAGAATVAGVTLSPDFPVTAGAFDTTYNGNGDAFVTRLDPSVGTIFYSTYLGGSGGEDAKAVAVDASGAATVVGGTGSTDFPTTAGAFDRTLNGIPDAFVTRLSPSGASLVYSTFLGSGEAAAVAVDGVAAATVAGRTAFTFPTTPGAFSSGHGGGDAFVARLDLLPTGATAFGASTPGCGGALAVGVTSLPQIGNADFAITCNNAPPNALGVIFLAADGRTTPVVIVGAQLWLDPASAFFASTFALSDAQGVSSFPLPLPANPSFAGAEIDAQFFWAGPTAPPPCPATGLSASNALEIVIQP